MAEAAEDGRRLRVDLDIDPSDDWECPIVSETPDASAVAVNAVGHECTVDVQPTGDDGLVRARGEVSTTASVGSSKGSAASRTSGGSKTGRCS